MGIILILIDITVFFVITNKKQGVNNGYYPSI